MDFFPLLALKSQLYTPEELFLRPVNNIIDSALLDTLWTGCPGTYGDLERLLRKVSVDGLLKISLLFKVLCSHLLKGCNTGKGYSWAVLMFPCWLTTLWRPLFIVAIISFSQTRNGQANRLSVQHMSSKHQANINRLKRTHHSLTLREARSYCQTHRDADLQMQPHHSQVVSVASVAWTGFTQHASQLCIGIKPGSELHDFHHRSPGDPYHGQAGSQESREHQKHPHLTDSTQHP